MIRLIHHVFDLSFGTYGGMLGGLLGLAWANTAPGSMPVATPAGNLPVGDITLPVALVLVGIVAGKAVTALTNWKPYITIEHRHVKVPPGDEP
jgi:hypothetical protein